MTESTIQTMEDEEKKRVGVSLEMQPLSSSERKYSIDEKDALESESYNEMHEADLDLARQHQKRSWKEYFFPTNIPRPLQIWRIENLAVPFCYLVVGLLQGM